MRGTGTHSRHTRLRATATGLIAVTVAAMLAACGGESSSDANEPSGTYRVAVTDASFPSEQDLGETSLMQLDIRNTGDRKIPALTVAIGIGGREGQDSALPFGVSDPGEGLAQPDRPVWVLSASYPRLDGSEAPGGATTSSPKTFSLGPLKPGDTTSAVWKLNAVRVGKYTVHYRIEAGLSGSAKAETSNGVPAGGSFVAEISSELPETEVTDSGEVVEIEDQDKGSE